MREVFEQHDAVVEPIEPAVAPAGPYSLRVRDLHAGWIVGEPDVLRGVDLDIANGSRTVVVGASGSGKSTLAAVLLRLLDPSSGTVELVGADGRSTDITDLAGDDVRSIIGWCAQDAHLFDSTIEENLRLARPTATVDDMRDALRGARLLDWVDELPRGLGTMVGEHGNHLSGGQRQRLALARVLLADRAIVIFDEPTEHLDDATAAALAVDLLDATVDRTVLVITHRPELFTGADAVVRITTAPASRSGEKDHVKMI
jgi:ABC-type bacteriocin/lantibiotic exporter with double-glycine peptidase domain